MKTWPLIGVILLTAILAATAGFMAGRHGIRWRGESSDPATEPSQESSDSAAAVTLAERFPEGETATED